MSLSINLRHLETQSQELVGEITAEELDLESGDELVALNHPLRYDLEVQLLEQGILVQGRLELPIDCECVRCLKPFAQTLVLDPWACHLALEGEEKVAVVNDSVDLTPQIREDIFLAFPQHPLCDASCSGLKTTGSGARSGKSPAGGTDSGAGEGGGDGPAGGPGDEGGGAEPSPWSVLDRLKLK